MIKEIRQALTITLLILSLAFSKAGAQNNSLPAVFFTDPGLVSAGQEDPILLNKILELVNAVPPGEEITVCVFKFAKGKLARALLEAQDRGVKVRIIMNKGETSKDVNRETKEYFDSGMSDFHYISNTLAKKAIVHNKFILFSKIEIGSQAYVNVVLQTSSNFLDKGTGKLQDLIVISDQGLYYEYLDFWYDIKVLGTAGQMDEYDYQKFERSHQYKAYFFPKRKDGEEFGKDEVVKILDQIKNPGSANIRFAHGKWTPGREKIIKKIDELISQGASVEIVTNQDLDKEVILQLEDLDAELTLLKKNTNLHTKFFLVDDGVNKIVYTGSHNLSERSLRDNFEVLLEVRDGEVYDQYLSFFMKINQLH